MPDTPFAAPKTETSSGSKALRVILIVVVVGFACAGLGSIGTIVGLTMLGQSLENSFEEIERSIDEPSRP